MCCFVIQLTIIKKKKLKQGTGETAQWLGAGWRGPKFDSQHQYQDSPQVAVTLAPGGLTPL